MSLDKPVCPRCGTDGVLPTPEKALELAAAMPAPRSLRADQEQYTKRLAVCAVCEAVRMGVLCAHCGCYVQFRALPVKSRCPHPGGDRWTFDNGYA